VARVRSRAAVSVGVVMPWGLMLVYRPGVLALFFLKLEGV
jgi:hypothetical protein